MDQSETCRVCGTPSDLFEVRHAKHADHFCSWSCVMVFAASKERDFQLHLVTLAEKHSSALRVALTRAAAGKDPDAERALDQLDQILSAIRAGA